MRLTTPLVLALAVLFVAGPLEAQSARGMYTRQLAREKKVRSSMAAGRAAAAARREANRVVVGYEQVVRRFPRSGYSDNALWQAAMLAAESYARYRVAADRDTAMEMLRWLMREYPTSSLVRRARPALNRLKKEAEPPAPVRARAPAPPRGETADVGEEGPAFLGAAPEVLAGSVAELRAVRRTVLPTVIRIAIELDRQVGFAGDVLSDPARVFLDLESTRRSGTVPETLSFGDPLVESVRFGPRPDGATRVVLDLERGAHTSVFTLSNPFRIVVDVARERDAVAATLRLPENRAPARPPTAERSAPVERVTVDAPEAVTMTPPLETETAAAARPAAPLPARRPAAGTSVTTPPPVPAPPTANLEGRFSLSRQLGLGIARIVIDAGHGGHDPGTQSRGLKEKELVLDVALRLEKLLLAEPGVEVVLTRRTDTFVDLEERTAIANREAADLFISIHANASRNRSARGVETYFLNFASNQEAEAVAARENSASAGTMHNLPDIVKAIALNNKLDESRDFATLVQRSMVKHLKVANKGLRDLGVKQAPFVVLIGAGMPSILAEISFVTHAQEGRLLKTSAYRQRIADALFEGIQRYQQSLKKVRTVASQE